MSCSCYLVLLSADCPLLAANGVLECPQGRQAGCVTATNAVIHPAAVAHDAEKFSTSDCLETVKNIVVYSKDRPQGLWIAAVVVSLMLCVAADDAYKIKAYNPDTKTACATYLGPTFGGPINKLLPFR